MVIKPENSIMSNGVNKDLEKAVSNDQNPENSNSTNNEVITKMTKTGSDDKMASGSKNDNKVNIKEPKTPKPKPNIREYMVTKAILFLMHEDMRYAPLEKKICFLRKKCLTDEEIVESFYRAHKCNTNQNSYSQNQLHNSYNSSYRSDAVQTPYESRNLYGSPFISDLAITCAVLYTGYRFYKNFIAKWLFNKPKSPFENRLELIESEIKKMKEVMNKNNLKSEDEVNNAQELKNIQAELKSIKKMIGNRYQFPRISE